MSPRDTAKDILLAVIDIIIIIFFSTPVLSQMSCFVVLYLKIGALTFLNERTSMCICSFQKFHSKLNSFSVDLIFSQTAFFFFWINRRCG